MNLSDARKILLDNGFQAYKRLAHASNSGNSASGAYTETWLETYSRSDEVISIAWRPDARQYVFLKVIQARDLVESFGHSSWQASDLIETANEVGIDLTTEQANYLLESWDSKLREAATGNSSGWDIMEARLEDVEICSIEDCINAIDIIGDDEDGSYQTLDGSVCPKCKIEKNMKSCVCCEQYSPADEMTRIEHNSSEASYYCDDCPPRPKQEQTEVN